MPWSSEMRPETSIVMEIEEVTDDDWMTAVSTMPASTRTTDAPGKSMEAMKAWTASFCAKTDIEPLIVERPTKSMPRPARRPPRLLVFSDFVK